MPDIHLFQWVVAFLAALGLTASWLLIQPAQRWRHIVSALVSALLWIIVAYTSGNVAVASQGQAVSFGSEALGAFAIFMVVVDIVGLVLGLLLWTEAEAEDASRSLPDDLRRPGD